MVAVPSIGRATAVTPRPAAPEADATRRLYDTYGRQILNFCVNQLGNRQEAEDATQTTFLNAFRGLQRGIDPEFESAWLFKIAHNVCLTRQRSSFRRRRVESPGDLDAIQDLLPSPQKDTDELIRLTEALHGMPEQQRRALLLREWQGLSYKEISDELELSQAAVETLLFRARRSLASGLTEEVPAKGKRKRLRAGGDAGSVVALVKTLFFSGGVKLAATVATVAAGSVVAATPATRHAVEHALVPPKAHIAPAVPVHAAPTFVPARAEGSSRRSADALRDVPLATAPLARGDAHQVAPTLPSPTRPAAEGRAAHGRAARIDAAGFAQPLVAQPQPAPATEPAPATSAAPVTQAAPPAGPQGTPAVSSGRSAEPARGVTPSREPSSSREPTREPATAAGPPASQRGDTQAQTQTQTHTQSRDQTPQAPSQAKGERKSGEPHHQPAPPAPAQDGGQNKGQLKKYQPAPPAADPAPPAPAPAAAAPAAPAKKDAAAPPAPAATPPGQAKKDAPPAAALPPAPAASAVQTPAPVAPADAAQPPTSNGNGGGGGHRDGKKGK